MPLTSPQPRIIVVDDDADLRRLLEHQLRKAGYDVVASENGQDALQSITNLGSGIIVADWSMPGMSGLELCRAVNDLRDMQAVGNTYFILLTALQDKAHVVEGLAAGANDYLTKPYDVGELLARVQVGERMLRLQDELLRRNIEVQKANAEMAMLANKLDRLANTDALTQLANRRCLFARFEETWHATLRARVPLSCIMVDVDGFKRINDTHGHACGDDVLVRVADCIRNSTPRPDLCGRFGGEEFLVLLPGLSAVEATSVAEELRLHVAHPTPAGVPGPVAVTVSCGVAERQSAGATPDELVRHADAMLYLAKQHGRNQTWVCGADGQGTCATDAHAAAPPPPSDSRVRRRNRTWVPVESPHAPADHE
jgi:two-component system chemotaxis response regulator CheY